MQQPWTPSLWRINDWNIMDDVKAQLPKADLNAINNIRMYLQIMNLSEITNASGTTILPHAMEPGHSSA